MEKFKYILNYTEEEATIRVYKKIGGFDGCNGSDFANEMDYLQDKCKKINVRINSGGGSVLDAFAIYNSIINSKVPCHTFNDGLAASAAAIIFLAGKKCSMVDYGIMMIHNGHDTTNVLDKEILNLFNASIAKMISNRIEKTEEEVVAMMAKETWLNAKEALANKMVDSIYSTEKKMKTPKVKNISYLELIYNEIINENKTNMKEINKALGLAENATEGEIINAIAEIKKNSDELKGKVDSFIKEKSDSEKAAKEALLTKATELANQLEKEKKITAEEKHGVIKNASTSEESFGFVKNTFDKLNATVKSPVSNLLDLSKVDNSGERTKWSWSDWSKKDVKGLENMLKNDTAAYKELYKKEFGVEPRI